MSVAPRTEFPESVYAVAGQLVDWANEHGGHDNITVALGRVEAETSRDRPRRRTRRDPRGALARLPGLAGRARTLEIVLGSIMLTRELAAHY